MNIKYKPRNLNSNELRILRYLKTKTEKNERGKIKFYHFLIAGLLGVCLIYITSIIPDSFWTLILGTLAVFSFAFIVFTPYEIYKAKKQHKEFLNLLNSLIEKGTVETCQIESTKIAIAPEYEDENDMYIIKLNENEVLYIWDTEYKLNRNFPSLKFEIYGIDFFKITGKQINPLSEKILPLKIDRKAKWNFMKQYGIYGHLEIEKSNFEKLILKYKNCA
ncbi:hypothetical protein ESY86_20050 [Subsaximicrobium wynnwilliamsii]|uniref:Uncharacterized protein n=1 Tax=Subsaximicrobium wynnwilliamsii TaxID=291179 RepID=A0A5C6ZC43_9FLAO|nr:hypothetical protein [Subsaximicrobium wynnwilliamsii]TXD80774.1 hypothetical protein ESY87_20185 [Subsaximicrobium wynnwilliamsii]TXD86506.1 hypothetical protein ESY86_20050 [Subsaximicrobium wynnwilliamsii]TXE00108.1 hypothetical protein ESY88_20020 [Subsaximicrobium wynnwilliamsii]